MAIHLKAFIIAICVISSSVWAGPVDYYGQLEASGNRIHGAKSELVVPLRGMSFFWSHWSGHLWTKGTVNTMVDDYKVNVVRAAVTPNDWWSDEIIWQAIERGVYVIIDWHSHHGDVGAAQGFFRDVAQKFGSYDNVIFEIYNEPLGKDNHNYWKEDIKPFAEQVIPVIREHSDNIVIVGTRAWSQRVDDVPESPLDQFENIGYTIHFYADSHREELRMVGDVALASNLPLMATEYGTVHASGGGSPNFEETEIWYDWMDERGISWAAWAINDKDETSSIWHPSYSYIGDWIKGHMHHYQDVSPWHFAAAVTEQGTPLAREALIDNLDDDGLVSFWGGTWSSENDAVTGGATTVTPSEALPQDGTIQAAFVFDNGYGGFESGCPQVGLPEDHNIGPVQEFVDCRLKNGGSPMEPTGKIVLTLNAEGTAQDLSTCTAIQYDYKGSAHHFRVAQGTIENADQYHRSDVAPREDWSTATINVENLKQSNVRKERSTDLDLKNIHAFVWQAYGATGTSSELLIDNVTCIGAQAPTDANYEDEVPFSSADENESSQVESSVGESSSSVDRVSSSDQDGGLSSSSETKFIGVAPDKDSIISPIIIGEQRVSNRTLIHRVNSNGVIGIDVQQTGVYSVVVYDIMGNHVASLGAQSLYEGNQTLSFNTQIGEGLYIIKADLIR
ncbi:MAG: glycoside hydrolase family 5 protein [Fibrobacterales bacterium]